MNPDGHRDLTRDAAAAAGPPRALIIGYGNPLRSDDGIGWRVAEELRGRVDASRIEVIECRQLTPEMAEQIRTAGLVVFVDAAAEGAPGEWRHHRLRAEDSGNALSHGPTPAALLALAADLYGAAPEVHLFTVSGSSFHYGESFSPEVTQALPLVVAEIEGLLRAPGRGNAAG
jgi:hydrogenase maturation protease